MAISHDPAERHAVEYILDCLGCGALIDCSADTNDEANADIDAHLDSLSDLHCPACQPMHTAA